jgi:mono/diheme cytochrome c family protein
VNPSASGGGRGGGRRPAVGALLVPREPTALTALAAGVGDLAAIAKRIAARVSWPGKPVPALEVTPLTPEEEKRFAAGREIYRNICAGCHQTDGQGREKLAPGLVESHYVMADPAIAARIVLAGKEGKFGLMPPLGSALDDDRIAAVLTYIRREWGHTGSPVAPADVKEVRGLTASHKHPWTEAELERMATGRRGQ